ncbi:MAG TPA: NAD(+)/NADH kinase [Verrucomicrobiae bacterium]|nr:NAD(+)/NADH kinase [Verrucomicrobiae bacterium]
MKKNAETIRRIGLLAHFEKRSSRNVVREAAELIARAGRVAVAEAQTARMAGLDCATFDDPAALAAQADLLLVFGGDGSMLRTIRETNGSGTPILGINLGRLGFLTAISDKNIADGLEKLWRDDFVIESRPLVEATGQCQSQPILMTALNDIVISRGAVSRLIELEVSVNEKYLTCYRGDGLVLCTPTGSTAYSLSAGGPIISPSAEVFAITPICAHALSNRAVIISSSSVVSVKLLSKEMETIMAADGQIQANLSGGDTVTIRRSPRVARLLHPGETTFFDTVRQKLHWRGSSV